MTDSSKKRTRLDIENENDVDEEIGERKSKIEEETKEKINDYYKSNKIEQIEQIKQIEQSDKNINMDYPDINSDNIYINRSSNQIYKSNFKNTFLNAIWKLEIPLQDFNQDFRYIQIFEARRDIQCTLLLDFTERLSEFSFGMQLGKGEDLEKTFEIEKVLNSDNFENINNINNCNNEDLKNNLDNENQEMNSQITITNAFSHDTQIADLKNNCSQNVVDFSKINENLNFLNNMSNSDNTSVEMNRHDLSDIMDENTQMRNNEEEVENLHLNLTSDNKVNNKNKEELQVTPNFGEKVNKRESDNYSLLENENVNKDENGITEQEKIRQMRMKLANSNYQNINQNNNTNSLITKIIKNENQNDPNLSECFNINLNFCLVNAKYVTMSHNKISSGDIIQNKVKINKQDLIKRNENVTIVIEITVQKYNSASTNYLGIVNEGMTCYMNSMLQTLNVLHYFKKAVFEIPINQIDKNSVAYSLQKIFYDLMKEDKPISAMCLIKALGWGKDQVLVQHDIQEFNLILSERLDRNMRGTKSEGTYRYLFEGKALNYINCVNVNYKSTKEENFNDIQLTVKGCNNLYESFDKYTEEEILDNDDKYEAEGFGKQIAKKGIKFIKLPNVLILQLKRFEYNFERDYMEKVNDFFEFYPEIDLDKYTTNLNHHNINTINENQFTLHSVMVHSGSTNGGHYYAFIRPGLDNTWIKFNDEIVKPADDYEVFENNFGGMQKSFRHSTQGNIIETEFKSDSNAYILVYIKNILREEILCKLTMNDIPEELKRNLENDKIEEKRQQLIILRQNNNFNLSFFTRETLLNYNSLGFMPNFKINVDSNYDEYIFKMSLNLPKDMMISEFIEFIHNVTNIPIHKIKLFKFVYLHQNFVKRFFNKLIFVEENYYNRRIIDIVEIKPNKGIFSIYIHIDQEENENLSLFEINPNFNLKSNAGLYNSLLNLNNENEQEFIINEEMNRIIYYNKNNNFWIFKFNENIFDTNNSLEFDHSDDKIIICAIKFLNIKFNKQNELETNLILGDVLSLNKKESLNSFMSKINFLDKYKPYIDENILNMIKDYKNARVTLLVENSSLDDLVNINKRTIETKTIIPVKNELPVELIKNDGVCLIVNLHWKEKILLFEKEYDSLLNIINEVGTNLQFTLNLPIYFVPDIRLEITKPFLNEKRLKIKIDKSENLIKEEILNNLKNDKKIIQDLLNLNDCEYYIYNQNCKLINFNDLIQNSDFNSDSNFIELITSNERDKEIITNLSEEIPTSKYLHKKVVENNPNYFIKFKFNFVPKDLVRNFNFINLFLFDEDFNPIIKLGLVYPRNLNTCKDFISFLKEKEIIIKFYKKFYTIDEEMKFLFIIQNPEIKFAYDILFNPNDNLRKHEHHTIQIEYRLQLYINDNKNLIMEKNKIYIIFVNKDMNTICYPLIIFLHYEITTLYFFKNYIIEKMTAMKFFLNYFKNSQDNFDVTKIKFYTFKLQNYKPIKENYLHPNFDDHPLIDKYFSKSRPNNIMVEVPNI